MSELRRAWLDAGGRDFLSTPVLVAFLAWSIASTMCIEVIASGAPLLPWLGASAASSLVVVLVLVPLRWLTLHRSPDGPGPVLALVVYLTAGVLRGALVWSAAEALDLSSSVGLASRIANSAAWSIVVMGSASIVVARMAAHRRLMSGLAHRRQELLALQWSLDERIQQTRSDLVQEVHDELGPTLAQLRSRLDSLAVSTESGVDEAIEGFQQAVANVVRPLSRTLVTTLDGPHPTPSEPSRSDAPRTHERLPLSEVVAPAASAGLVLLLLALLAAGVAPDAYRTAGTPVRLLVFVAALWLGLRTVRWISAHAGWRLTVTTLIASLACAYLLVGILAGLLVLVTTARLAVPSTTFPALVVALAALAPLAVSTAAALQMLARRAELSSAETVAQLEILTAALRRELWRERRRLALTVHGPVQSALVAAAVSLSRPGFTSADVPALAAALDQAMTNISRSDGKPPPITAAFRDLAALWTDSAQVTFAADASVAELIDADEPLRTTVVEVMREGVSNAVRHGAADSIAIGVSSPVPGIIRVTIDDDGDGPPMTASPGLGSSMLDDVALDWSLTRAGTITSLEVELGIDGA